MMSPDSQYAIEFAGVGPNAQVALRLVQDAHFHTVSAAALGATTAVVRGALQARGLVVDHADRRTIGIIRVSGMADVAGQMLAWSAVAKIVDLGIVPDFVTNWVHPENEPIVYAGNHFAGDGQPFRPARCYLITHSSPTVTILWLEDLTAAGRAPFDLDQLAQIARHVGQWNGWHVGREHGLPFRLGEDSFECRWRDAPHAADLRKFLAMRDTAQVVAMYGSRSTELPGALLNALRALNARAAQDAHALCFGDCNVGNVFWYPDKTVAVDWSGLTIDPLGVDAGSVIGSAISWGKGFVETAKNERDLFESYLAGLAESGWHGNRFEVRRSFFLQYGFYLMLMVLMPASLERYGRERIERRLECTWDELPERCAGLVDLIPAYLEELSGLA